ncbi:MAG: efflux RND transporter periplasmic adaptor subunit [Planctomycetaceae bacterium]|nr:efflux RND transporter periplasmic adaptor subunit [Planctomycetaceae bacterium]
MSRLGSTVGMLVKTVLPALAGLIGLGLIIAWLSGAFIEKVQPGRVEQQPEKLEGQSTEQVHEVLKDYIEEAVGTLKAANRTEVSSKVLATIQEVTVAAGDLVKEGDPLIRLDNSELEARVQQAEQSLSAARAAAAKAKVDFERLEKLVARNATSKSEFDAAEVALNVAIANEMRAEQSVQEARVVRSYAMITSPRSGRVVDRLAEPGDTARPGQPLLVIYDAASLRLEAPVSEHLAVRMKVGDRLTVHVDAVNRTTKAVVDQIVPQADAPSRSFLVKATVPRADDLFEGMFGRLLIPAGQRTHLCLAQSAVHEVGQLQFVQVVRDDNTLERRMIRTGQVGMPGRVEVLSGLSVGERVIVHEEDAESTPADSDAQTSPNDDSGNGSGTRSVDESAGASSSDSQSRENGSPSAAGVPQ